MGTAPQKEKEACINVTLPTELCDQVSSLADKLGSSMDLTVATLLRYGLQFHEERSAKIATLSERIAGTADEKEAEVLSNELGELIFTR